jgi:hypothetical protein
MSKQRTAYQRIRDAARRGTGCRLSADECFRMGTLDDAIFTRAQLDDHDDEFRKREGRDPTTKERAER